jgi:hypothetical protein
MSGESRIREETADGVTEPAQPLFTRSRCVVSRVAGAETLVVPVRGKVGSLSSIYSLKGTGSFLWQLLDMPRALPELVGGVQREFGVGQEQAQREVTQFLDDMLSAGLVQSCQRVEVTAIEMTATESRGMFETAGSL